MTDQPKYYTPDISEFHVGFEYEAKQSFMDGTVKTSVEYERAEWKLHTVCVGDIPYIDRALNGKNAANGLCGIRVKYLDREGIESLGYSHEGGKLSVGGQQEYEGLLGTKGLISIFHTPINSKVTIKGKNKIRDGSGKWDGWIIYFDGKIYNKSELKNILQLISR